MLYNENVERVMHRADHNDSLMFVRLRQMMFLSKYDAGSYMSLLAENSKEYFNYLSVAFDAICAADEVLASNLLKEAHMRFKPGAKEPSNPNYTTGLVLGILGTGLEFIQKRAGENYLEQLPAVLVSIITLDTKWMVISKDSFEWHERVNEQISRICKMFVQSDEGLRVFRDVLADVYAHLYKRSFGSPHIGDELLEQLTSKFFMQLGVFERANACHVYGQGRPV